MPVSQQTLCLDSGLSAKYDDGAAGSAAAPRGRISYPRLDRLTSLFDVAAGNYISSYPCTAGRPIFGHYLLCRCKSDSHRC
jgi:hypothetical protein